MQVALPIRPVGVVGPANGCDIQAFEWLGDWDVEDASDAIDDADQVRDEIEPMLAVELGDGVASSGSRAVMAMKSINRSMTSSAARNTDTAMPIRVILHLRSY